MSCITPITPLEPGVEMFQRPKTQPFFPTISPELANEYTRKHLSVVHEVPTPATATFLVTPRTERPRPVSEVTEIFETDEDDGYDDDDTSEFEEDYEDFISFQSREARNSQTTISTFEEIATPQSAGRDTFADLRFNYRPSVEGPRGPHLFRSSTVSSEFSLDYALQLSPLLPKRQSLRIETELELRSEPTPTTIHATPAAVPPVGEDWNIDEPRTWTASQVALWMYNCGIEHAIVEKFEFHDITGTVLLDLQFQDLKELGIQSFGKRHQVWNQICSLRGGEGHGSSAPTPFQDTDRPVSTLTRSQSLPQNKPADQSRDEPLDECVTPITPGTKRRRRKHRKNGDEPITPGDSVSIVAIEQLIPRRHKCAKGEACSKWKKQQALLKRLQHEHGFPVSPEKGGHIFIAGDPGNAVSAPNIVENVHRPVSDVGPSVVASSDLLGPGEMPQLSLDEEHLKHVEERDPQENVKKFLTLQQVEPPVLLSPVRDDALSPDTMEAFPELKGPLNAQPARAQPQSLPRLEIPRHSTLEPNHDAFSADYTPCQTVVPDNFSPCQAAIASPTDLYRFGTPASEMDVPITSLPIDPFGRDQTSQSVPPNMHFRDPVQRSASRGHSRRPSTALPPVNEVEVFSPAGEPNPGHHGGNSAVPNGAAYHTMSPKAASDGETTPPHAQLYDGDVNHHGWMKKRKTRLLRHEWHDHHFRLTGSRLAMHADDHPSSYPLDTLNIDDYAVACSSLASNKLAAKLKAFKISQDKQKHSQVNAPFSFQLVPTTAEGEREMGKLQKAMAGAKTHHFAVRTRDERIDWMRELMLAKALRAKGEGYSVEINGNAI